MTSEKGVVGDLVAFDGGDSIEQILRDMFADKNIEMKSNFRNPVVVSKMRLLAEWCNLEGLTGTSKLITTFVQFYEKDVVSEKGTGRTQLYEAVSGLIEKDRSIKDKLLDAETK
jgi:hypothetical protein